MKSSSGHSVRENPGRASAPAPALQAGTSPQSTHSTKPAECRDGFGQRTEMFEGSRPPGWETCPPETLVHRASESCSWAEDAQSPACLSLALVYAVMYRVKRLGPYFGPVTY